MCVDSIHPISAQPALTQKEETRADRIAELMQQVVEQKRKNIEELDEKRSLSYLRAVEKDASLSESEKSCEKKKVISYLFRRTVSYVSDAGGAVFSVFQGIALFVGASFGIALTGAIGGVVGGVLTIGQGLGIFFGLACQSFNNGQCGQGVFLTLQSIGLICIGVIMVLISLAAMTSLFAAAAGLIALISNPYVMPVLLLILVVPTLAKCIDSYRCSKQILNYLLENRENKKTLLDYFETLVPREELREKILKKLREEGKEPLLGEERLDKEQNIALQEHLAEHMGPKAALAVGEVFSQALAGEPISTELLETARAEIARFRRHKIFQGLHLSLYLSTLPLGGLAKSRFIQKGAALACNAATRLAQGIASAIGSICLSLMKYTGNSPEVPRAVELEQLS